MNLKTRLRVFSGVLVIILAGAFFCLPAVHGQTADQKDPAPQKTTTPAPSTAIPVPEIATRATEVSNLLRALNTRLASSSRIDTIQKLLPEVSERIDRKLTEGIDILEEQPTLEILQAEEQLWKGIEAQTAGWLKVLTERAVRAQGCAEPALRNERYVDQDPQYRAGFEGSRAGAPTGR